MFELLSAGGFLVWPILLCSVLAFGIVGERLINLRKNKIVPPQLMRRIDNLLRRGVLDNNIINEIERSSVLGQILAAGLRTRNEHRVVVKEAVEEAGRYVVPELERNLQTLGTIAAITPLLGLLGTVIGMIKVFAAITTFGVGDPQALAEGISEALVTTAAGLSVGIPSLMFHRFFRGKVNQLSVEMEQKALKFVQLLQRS